MIECDVCGNFFHADDICDCPNENCTFELCQGCYQKHVSKCLNSFIDDDDYEVDDLEEGEENMNRNINIVQNALAGLYIGDEPDILEADPMAILDIARNDERLDSFGEAFLSELSEDEVVEIIQNLKIEYIKMDEFGFEVDNWKICEKIIK